MTCLFCGSESSHIKILNGVMSCHACGNFSESGQPTDKILTRNATRIADQQVAYEQDMITPYVVNHSTKQIEVNEDFISLYPESSAGTFTEAELKSVGQNDLKIASHPDHEVEVEFKGDAEKAIGDIVGSNGEAT